MGKVISSELEPFEINGQKPINMAINLLLFLQKNGGRGLKKEIGNIIILCKQAGILVAEKKYDIAKKTYYNTVQHAQSLQEKNKLNKKYIATWRSWKNTIIKIIGIIDKINSSKTSQKND